ncbi:hypothetical protein DAPPUDRAFT_112047 [Daphnia pulex]|uniref:Uncharacterized protein n=1 Tax=Daphnia pulex TaxID=6669 RepID=E9HAT3_DAPPU|nr:hypothetical protein DAPPUDRAFT_112047 [Daphnia pulex]|eukprot:EFX71162.1 hypothetical protein DAPPUDRAFT_112047 [Daphnia pulex]
MKKPVMVVIFSVFGIILGMASVGVQFDVDGVHMRHCSMRGPCGLHSVRLDGRFRCTLERAGMVAHDNQHFIGIKQYYFDVEGEPPGPYSDSRRNTSRPQSGGNREPVIQQADI